MNGPVYPRPDFTPSGPYPKDRTWGIVVIVLSVLGILLGGALVTFGNFLSSAMDPLTRNTKSDSADPVSHLASFFSAGLLVFGVGLIVISAFRFAGGIGIMRGARWGFWVTAVTSGLAFLFDLLTFNGGMSVVSLLVSGFLFQYCLRRLNGKEGPLVA